MDMDDDDAFLYGDDGETQETAKPAPTQVTGQKPKVEETCSYRFAQCMSRISSDESLVISSAAAAPIAGVSAAMAA